jgi:hypothetical protein
VGLIVGRLPRTVLILVTTLLLGLFVVVPPPQAGAAGELSYTVSGFTPTGGLPVAGGTVTASFTVNNTGSEAWVAGTAVGNVRVAFGVVATGTADDATWLLDQTVSLPNDVASGAGATFNNVPIQLPAEGGNYNIVIRVVKEGVAWFDQDPAAKFPITLQALTRTYALSGFAPSGGMPVAGGTVTASIAVTNTGTAKWVAGSAAPADMVGIGVVASGTPDDATWLISQRLVLPNDVAPGTTATFNNVPIQLPAEGGNYNIVIRMVQEGVAWFAQDPNAKIPIPLQPLTRSYALASIAPVSGMPPVAGGTMTVNFSVTNTGSEAWVAGTAAGNVRVAFGVVATGTLDDATWLLDQTVALPNDVAFGASATFTNVPIRLPAEAGNYNLVIRMVKEGVAWFNQDPNAKIPLPVMGATRGYMVTGFSTSGTPMAGGTVTASFTVNNVGTEKWVAGNAAPADMVGIGVVAPGAPDDATWDIGQRLVLPNDVAPGASVTFNNVPIQLPAEPGVFNIVIRMVQEGVAWFNQDPAAKFPIPVQGTSLGYTATGFSTSGMPVAGGTVAANFTVNNTGTETWVGGGDHPIRLGIGVVVPGTSDDATWLLDQSVALPHDVAPGASVTFTNVPVQLLVEGGNYNIVIRVVKEGVTWFTQDPNAKFPITVYGAMLDYAVAGFTPTGGAAVAGGTVTASITVINTGSDLWTAGSAVGNVRMGIGVVPIGTPDDATWVLDQSVAIPHDVVPGGSATLNNVPIQLRAEPGAYNIVIRMVQEGVAWFDQDAAAKFPITVQAATLGYAVSGFSTSGTPVGGRTVTASFTVTNTGSGAWAAGAAAGNMRVGIGVVEPWVGDDAAWCIDQRADLPNDVAPGASATFNNVPVQLRADPGNYNIVIRIVQEGVVWFDQDAAAKYSITVN